MKAGVVVFPGSNCDRDVAVAIEASAGEAPAMLWHKETELPRLDLIVLPGGFAYGDYLRCGAIAAHSPIMRAVKERAAAGTPVLAICNGFQVACEAGLLPGALIANAGLKFVCRDVHLRVETSQTMFAAKYAAGQVVRMPVAHHDGQYVADEATLDRLEGEGRVVFRYCDETGAINARGNPNGAQRNIAGICDGKRRILGLMPHPERLYEQALGGTGGRRIFESALASLAAA